MVLTVVIGIHLVSNSIVAEYYALARETLSVQWACRLHAGRTSVREKEDCDGESNSGY